MATTYTPISTVNLSSLDAVTFSSIPNTYTDLVIVINGAIVTGTQNLNLRFNGDTSSIYSRTFTGASGSGYDTSRENNYSYITLDRYGYFSSTPTNYVIDIMNYKNTNIFKSIISKSGNPSYGIGMVSGLWRSTSAITSITLYLSGSTWTAGSTASLYGIASPAVTNIAKATGGDTIATDGTYWYHAFRTSGTFTPTQSLTADILVVAGGGGGSGNADSGNTAGGGGAGGFLVHTTQTLSTPQTVTVGAGGNGGPSVGGGGGSGVGNGSKGSNSQFGSLTASEGGGFGAFIGTGGNGGSGGGGNNGGLATAGQGNNGAGSVANYQAGGGGGAGGAGNTNGNGGVGASSYSSWGSATGTGQNVSGTYYYAGGGGGGQYFYTDGSGLGGSGGGGNSGRWNGSTVIAAISGSVNTGGGGGGAGSRDGQGAKVGANGGSGIIIVRYPV